MATVYQRQGNLLESLVASACAAACSRICTHEDAWYEINVLTRILRDIGLLEHATKTHIKAGEILTKLGLFSINKNRHEFLGLQIRMAKILRESSINQTDLSSLLLDVVDNAKEVLVLSENTTPVAAMLGQLIRHSTKSGLHVSDQVLLLQNQLQSLTGVNETRISSFSSKVPKASEVLAVHVSIETARYSSDVGYDSHIISIIAKRLLAGNEAIDDPKIAVFAIEMMSDRAIASPRWEASAKPVKSVSSIYEPANISASFSKESIAILFAGLDEEGKLLRVTVEAGNLSTVFCESGFSEKAYLEWQEDFPYRYGIDETTINLFYNSTENLKFLSLPNIRTLLIMSTNLQQIPPNLIRVDTQFSGKIVPMAAAPSLSWFKAVRELPARSNEKMTAWISAADKKGGTLNMIANRLEETLINYQIELDQNMNVVSSLVGSKLVIVAAHGGISSEGKFFQSVSDEGDLSFGSSDFANKLRNVGLVILFVCSGGRSDQHPTAHTTTGLVKSLLDQGCSAVIASPWPLDARVTYHWLPPFLESWTSGKLLIDANFEANIAVSKSFSDNPANCLAMNVFGDTFLKFT